MVYHFFPQAKQGYCIYRVRVKRGDRKKRVAKVSIRPVAVHFPEDREKILSQKESATVDNLSTTISECRS